MHEKESTYVIRVSFWSATREKKWRSSDCLRQINEGSYAKVALKLQERKTRLTRIMERHQVETSTHPLRTSTTKQKKQTIRGKKRKTTV